MWALWVDAEGRVHTLAPRPGAVSAEVPTYAFQTLLTSIRRSEVTRNPSEPTGPVRVVRMELGPDRRSAGGPFFTRAAAGEPGVEEHEALDLAERDLDRRKALTGFGPLAKSDWMRGLAAALVLYVVLLPLILLLDSDGSLFVPLVVAVGGSWIWASMFRRVRVIRERGATVLHHPDDVSSFLALAGGAA
jgi:hypothetical protein